MEENLASLVTANLRDYMLGVMQVSQWEIQDFGELLITINGNPQSLFNYVFCKEGVEEYSLDTAKYALSYLKDRKIEATWPIDPHMKKIRYELENLGIQHASTPKKAFLNLKNCIIPKDDRFSSLHLELVNDADKLDALDRSTSQIFYHDIGIVSTFLRGIANTYDPNIRFFLAIMDNKIVGTCGMYIHNGIAGFYSDGVFPEYRNKGIATQMILKRLEIAKNLNCKYVIAHCMKPSVNIYKRLGFKILGNLYLYISYI